MPGPKIPAGWSYVDWPMTICAAICAGMAFVVVVLALLVGAAASGLI